MLEMRPEGALGVCRDARGYRYEEGLRWDALTEVS